MNDEGVEKTNADEEETDTISDPFSAAVSAELEALDARGYRIHSSCTPFSALCVVTSLQVMIHDPNTAPILRDTLMDVIQALSEALSVTPALTAACRILTMKEEDA